MKAEHRELLLRATLNELSPEEATRVQELLTRDPDARSELERLGRLDQIMKQAPRPSFAPFFANRVMQRIRSERSAQQTASLAESLAWLFYRAAPAAVAVAAALFAFNVFSGRQESQSPLDAALGLPVVTLEAAYTFDATYYSVTVAEPTGEG